MTKISNLYTLTNYISANSSGNVVIAAPSSGYALDVTGTGRFASNLVVGTSSGGVSSPTNILMDSTYKSGSAAFDALKIFLYKSSIESYGFGLGDLSDMQYWAGASSTGVHRFFTSQTERVRISSSGNVGIGTTSPTRILDARGAVNLSTTAPTVSSTSGAYADLHLRTYWGATSSPSRITVVDNWIDYFATYTDGHRFRNWSSDGVVRDLMTITGSGNVGIGTTSPFSQGSGATTMELAGNTYGQFFVSANSASIRGVVMARASTLNDVYIASITNSPLLFGTNDTERMRITSGGDLLFGATSGYDSYSRFTFKTSTNAYFDIQSTSADAVLRIIGSNYGQIINNTGALYISSATDMIFRTNPTTERMRITSSGLVKIGVPTSEVNSMLAVVRDGAYPNDVSPAHLSLAGVTDSRMRMSLGYDTTNNYGWINAGQWGVMWTSMYLQKTGGAVYAGSARIDNNSDARVKDNIQPITGALQKVLSMNGKKFHMLDEPEDKIRFGFVAQELQGIVDELVIQSDRVQKLPNGETVENLLGLETWGSSWGALLVEAIKELSAKVTALENK